MQTAAHAPATDSRRLPFFEFMLYGTTSFGSAHPRATLAPVARGRSLTLLPMRGGVAAPAPDARVADGGTERGRR